MGNNGPTVTATQPLVSCSVYPRGWIELVLKQTRCGCCPWNCLQAVQGAARMSLYPNSTRGKGIVQAKPSRLQPKCLFTGEWLRTLHSAEYYSATTNTHGPKNQLCQPVNLKEKIEHCPGSREWPQWWSFKTPCVRNTSGKSTTNLTVTASICPNSTLQIISSNYRHLSLSIEET